MKKVINTLLVTCKLSHYKNESYIKSYDGQTRWIYFLIEDDNLLKKIILFGIKSVLILKKEFHSKPVYNEKILKTKIRSYGDEVTDFYNKEIHKVDSNHTCLAVVSLDSALKKDVNYYSEVCKRCKYLKKWLDILMT